MIRVPTRLRPGSSFARVFLPALLVFFALSALWSLATPVFGAPDENAHATKAIAQAHGQLLGRLSPESRFPLEDLPPEYSYTPNQVCFAYRPDVPAECGGAELGRPGQSLTFPSWVSTYNPSYAFLVGWPTLLVGGDAGIYAMRLVSGLICSVLFAFGFHAALAARRVRWMPVALLAIASPMTAFLAGTVSPQGVEILAAVAFWMAGIRLAERDSSSLLPRGYLWTILAISAALLSVARALGPLWVIIIAATVIAITGGVPAIRRVLGERRRWPWLAVIAAAAVFSVFWTLRGGSLSGQAEKADAPLVGGSPIVAAARMIRSTPGFLEESVGVFGWLDTPLHPLLYALAFGALAILLALALVATGRRGLRTLIVVGAMALLVPVVVQSISVRSTGLIWQGRYGLFLYVGVLLVAGWLLSERTSPGVRALSVRLTAVIGITLAVFQIGAFVYVLRRYVVGSDRVISEMVTAPQWQPPLGWPALVAAMVAVATATAALTVLAARAAARRDPVGAASATAP